MSLPRKDVLDWSLGKPDAPVGTRLMNENSPCCPSRWKVHYVSLWLCQWSSASVLPWSVWALNQCLIATRWFSLLCTGWWCPEAGECEVTACPSWNTDQGVCWSCVPDTISYEWCAHWLYQVSVLHCESNTTVVWLLWGSLPCCGQRTSSLSDKGVIGSTFRRTRKVVIYTLSQWSLGKLRWRLEAVLTCKSFVRAEHRGERLIELPSSWFPLKFPSG